MRTKTFEQYNQYSVNLTFLAFWAFHRLAGRLHAVQFMSCRRPSIQIWLFIKYDHGNTRIKRKKQTHFLKMAIISQALSLHLFNWCSAAATLLVLSIDDKSVPIKNYITILSLRFQAPNISNLNTFGGTTFLHLNYNFKCSEDCVFSWAAGTNALFASRTLLAITRNTKSITKYSLFSRCFYPECIYNGRVTPTIHSLRHAAQPTVGQEFSYCVSIAHSCHSEGKVGGRSGEGWNVSVLKEEHFWSQKLCNIHLF